MDLQKTVEEEETAKKGADEEEVPSKQKVLVRGIINLLNIRNKIICRQNIGRTI
jgi:hypothetical protein